MAKLEFTGERMTTEYESYGSIEHLHRYSVIMDLLRKDMTVVDVACGEGYGTKLISGCVARVIGVDISDDAILHATEKYKNPNIEFILASALSIPLEDNSADLVVSFETLEHLDEHDNMISELKRILKKDGILIISTPDRNNYSKGVPNPFHVRELSLDEFKNLLGRYFTNTRFFFQKTVHGSVLYSMEEQALLTSYEGDFGEIFFKPCIDKPDFIIAVASDSVNITHSLKQSFFDASVVFERESRDSTYIIEKYNKIVRSWKFKNLNRLLKIFGLGFKLKSDT